MGKYMFVRQSRYITASLISIITLGKHYCSRLLLPECNLKILFIVWWMTILIFISQSRGSKIEKVPRGIRGEKSSKDMANSRNLVSTIGAQASPKIGGRNQVSGMVSVPYWHAIPVANDPWKPLIIRWRSKTVSRSWNWWKGWLVWKYLFVKGKKVI